MNDGPGQRGQKTPENQTALQNEAGERLFGMDAESRWHKLSAMTPRAIAKASAGIERDLRHDYPVGGSDPRYHGLDQAASQITREKQTRIHPARTVLMELKDCNVKDAPSVLKDAPDRILETMHDQNSRGASRPGFTSEAPWRLPNEIGTMLKAERTKRTDAADRRDRGEIRPEDWKRWAAMSDGEMIADLEDLELPGLDAARNTAGHAEPSVQQVLNKEVEHRENLGDHLARDAMANPEKAAKWIPNLSNDHRELLHRGNDRLAPTRSQTQLDDGAGQAERQADGQAGARVPLRGHGQPVG